MNNHFILKEKLRLALCLVIIFAVSLLANYFIHQNVAKADKSLLSIYHDRLIPAQDIFGIGNKIYENELLLQAHINAASYQKYQEIGKEIAINNAAIDSLINKFGQTLLVKKEVTALEKYSSLVNSYLANQKNILALSEQGFKGEAEDLYKNKGQGYAAQLLNTVKQLASLQTSVGGELYKDGHQQLIGAELLSYLVIGLTIVIGLLAQMLLKTSFLSTHLPNKSSLN